MMMMSYTEAAVPGKATPRNYYTITRPSLPGSSQVK